MLLCFTLTLAGALCLLAFLRESVRRLSVRAMALKGAVSAMFVAVAAAGWYQSQGLPGGASPFGLFIIMGLLFGLLGDIWLGLKHVYPQDSDTLTRAGFIVFGVGHILFCAGMLLEYGAAAGHPLYYVVPIPLAILCNSANMLLQKPLGLSFGNMTNYVFFYGIALFSTLFFSGSLALSRSWNETTLNMIFIGSILFTASDLVLSNIYFGKTVKQPVSSIVNLLLYYAGQFIIAFSLLFARGADIA